MPGRLVTQAAPTVHPAAVCEAVEQGLARLEELPLYPATAQRALRLAESSQISLEEFARLIESDVALAAAIIRVANSSLYSWGRTISRLENAVVRLGLRECRQILLTLGVRDLVRVAQPRVRGHCLRLWQHSFVVGCLARLLNRELAYGYDGEEFTAGLLHDLGRILLALLVPEAFLVADPVQFDEDEQVEAREQQLLGLDHCTLGARFAEQKRFPDEVVTTIRLHHQVGEAKRCRGLVGLVGAADHLANHLHREKSLKNYDLETNPGFRAITRGWSEAQWAAFRARLPALLRQAAEAFAQSGLRG